MANYQINPNEFEEHSHTTKTTTTLEAGEATLSMMGRVQVLKIGVAIEVPENTLHKVQNTSKVHLAKVKCICG